MMKKKLSKLIAACLAATMMMSLAACNGGSGDEPQGEKEVGDRTQISFLCGNDAKSEEAWKELVAAYNDGVGYEKDKVFVNVTLGTNANPNTFTKSADAAYNVVMVTDSISNTFVNFAYKSDARKAPNGYLVNLNDFADADADFQKNTIPASVMDWWRMTRVDDAKKGAGQSKHIIGKGQNLVGVPIASNPHFNWYNERIFKEQGINIVSVPEDELEKYNTEHNAKLQPHGYAEYKDAPVEGMQSSVNLAGQTVYKVFNNCIGMNWEEQRNLLKYFTPTYNDGSVTGTKASTKYGFVSEYWFNYGWSVGGDVMGYNGKGYDFTLLDTHKNYIVTKDNTVINGTTYAAGEIVRYEDRVNALDNAASLPDGIYPIESQYNAVKEYVSLQVAPGTVVDQRDGKTYMGYGVADPDTGKASNWFNNGELAMTRGSELEDRKMDNPDFNICVPETYREYEGGSVYYQGGEGFGNEYLKVIGETYDGEVYTGELKVVDGTPIVGNSTSASISQALVIPACSDPEKYQAAWDFISWVATEGQKYIAKSTAIPVASETAFGAEFAQNEELSKGKNLYAVALMAVHSGRGDWGYFENGSWVTNWSGTFNDEVRRGKKTLTDFENEKSEGAEQALNDMYCVIKGIR